MIKHLLIGGENIGSTLEDWKSDHVRVEGEVQCADGTARVEAVVNGTVIPIKQTVAEKTRTRAI